MFGQRSNSIILATLWQTKGIRSQRSNVNAVNLQEKSHYLWNWILPLLVRRRTQNLDQKKHNSNKFTSDCQINSADLVSRHPYGILGEKSQMSSAKRL